MLKNVKSRINSPNITPHTHEGPQISAILEGKITLWGGDGPLPEACCKPAKTADSSLKGWSQDSEKDILPHLLHQHTGPGGRLFSASPLQTPSWASPQSVPASQLGWQWPVPHLGGGRERRGREGRAGEGQQGCM